MGTEAWLAFVAAAADAGSPVVALSPFPSERAPAALVRRVPWLHWDRRLTALDVRRRLRGRDRPEAR